jgi:PKD repeat protein
MKKLYSILALSIVSIAASAQCMILTGPTPTVNGLNVSVTGTGSGAAAPQYIYDWGDATSPGTTQTSTHTYATGGTYILCMYYTDLTNPSTCIDTSCISVTVSAVGINDPTATIANVNAVPNPFGSEVTINLTMTQPDMAEVAVFDITGKQVAILKSGLMAAGTNVIDWKPAGLSAGVYFLQVKTSNALITKKIVYTAQ